uniref:Uncharacterized protein n=1 Tax=Anguilla anguilla TaxID=7936 RepID=A0A0E9PDG2_ANGAN
MMCFTQNSSSLIKKILVKYMASMQSGKLLQDKV